MKKPLNRNLRIRLNEDEDKGLVVLAVALGEKTRSRVVRKMIRKKLSRGPDLLKGWATNTFREAIRQVAALGRNMNQIARAIHSGQVNEQCHWDPALLNAAIQQNKALEQRVDRGRDAKPKSMGLPVGSGHKTFDL